MLKDLSTFVTGLAFAALLLSRAYWTVIQARNSRDVTRKLISPTSADLRSDASQDSSSVARGRNSGLAFWSGWLFLLLSLAMLALLQFGSGSGKALATGDMATITIAAMLFYQSHRVMN
ncbi:MAG: hypothetical protein A2286_00295 [Gammaproteobacteria bacterium RIFOXYA12_FULL_61_12]|nr:MAG: hypothetical protein A2514_11275 [Gammaproteobacteria bacterium RIFOXYD12_FULL_61_37]OGT94031.1 MAG: hypothetical protein A2286_00295 [Gammaproteobacteria bacterium RIFOXYA12_FULL_61_12]